MGGFSSRRAAGGLARQCARRWRDLQVCRAWPPAPGDAGPSRV